jgi:hypothetical protein
MASINGTFQLKPSDLSSTYPDNIILTCRWDRITEEIKVQIELNLNVGKRVDKLFKKIIIASTDTNFNASCANYNYTPRDPSDSRITIFQFKEIDDASASGGLITFPNDRPGIGEYLIVGIEHLIVVELLDSTGGVVSTVQGIAD